MLPFEKAWVTTSPGEIPVKTSPQHKALNKLCANACDMPQWTGVEPREQQQHQQLEFKFATASVPANVRDSA